MFWEVKLGARDTRPEEDLGLRAEAVRVGGLPLPPQPRESGSWKQAQASLTSPVTLDMSLQFSDAQSSHL